MSRTFTDAEVAKLREVQRTLDVLDALEAPPRVYPAVWRPKREQRPVVLFGGSNQGGSGGGME